MSERQRWIGYVRVSTQEQGESGLGLDSQRERIEGAVRFKAGELVDVESDPGSSGKDMRRPGLQRALARIAAGEADGLIIAKWDRLTRSLRDTVALLDWFDDADAALWALDMDMNTGTPMGKAMAHVAAVFAELERERGGERTRDAMAQLKAQGKPVGPGAVPVDVADRIRTWRAEGVTLQAIADRLNAEGVPTVRGGIKWRVSSVETAARPADATPRKRRRTRAAELPAVPRRRTVRAA